MGERIEGLSVERCPIEDLLDYAIMRKPSMKWSQWTDENSTMAAVRAGSFRYADMFVKTADTVAAKALLNQGWQNTTVENRELLINLAEWILGTGTVRHNNLKTQHLKNWVSMALMMAAEDWQVNFPRETWPLSFDALAKQLRNDRKQSHV